ncbi:MAG: GNAT family N-acetyltransferase [Pseudomonadales bacterium]|nr:GNAT family N-acetyltransferase [Pseudomonadales bacterium]
MHIDEANLVNLTGLWIKYGSRPINGGAQATLHVNTHWPHRCWFDMNANNLSYTMLGHSNDSTWLEDIPESAVLPLWPMIRAKGSSGAAETVELQRIEQQLLDKKWRCTFEQTAMYLALQDAAVHSSLRCPGFQVNPVRTSEDIHKWVDIGSEAFAYTIDRVVIENLVNDNDIQMQLGWQDGQAVAAALLYKTGNIVGIHQVGVKQAFQGQGFARCFMQYIISTCALWQTKYLVLQASQLGQPLYESLGFTEQFTIKNYERV